MTNQTRQTTGLSPRILAPLVSLTLGFSVACGVIEDWTGGRSKTAAGASGQVADIADDLGGSGQGDPVAAFAQTTHPLLREHCMSCHAGQGPGTPHVASPDPAVAYDAVIDNAKVSWSAPDASRLVRRLSTDFHHCWSDCIMDGAEMLASIELWAELMVAVADGADADSPLGGGQQAGEAIASATQTLADGVVAEGQRRHQQDLVAFFEFKEGIGDVARDTSGVDPPMDLTLEGPNWLTNDGIDVQRGRAIASPDTSSKLFDEIAAANGTQEYSVEAWIVPANTDQDGPARIVSYSNGTQLRNFTFGQVLYYYNHRNRSASPQIGANGTPALQTAIADEDLQARLQHVVVTYDPSSGRRIYVDGVFTDDVDPQAPSGPLDWSSSYTFLLANETTNDRQWQGKIHLVAVFKAALTDAQIVQNFDAGVGERLAMRFDVGRWLVAGAYVEFVVSELDAASYLFCTPTLVMPVGSTIPVGSSAANLRISVNGRIPVTGQAFVNVDVAVVGGRQELSSHCSVVPKELGPEADVFAIEFEYLGDYQNPIIVSVPGAPPPRVFGDPMPTEGVRNFDRINETMAAVTGVGSDTPGLDATFRELSEQLPITFDLRSFASSHQVAISKLSLEYCDVLVETASARDAFFDGSPHFEFDQPVAVALSSAEKRDRLIDPLLERMVGLQIANQPTVGELRPVLDVLIDELTAGCDGATCGATRTRTVAKSACAALLSSAAVSVH